MESLIKNVMKDAQAIEMELLKPDHSTIKVNQMKQEFENKYGYPYIDSKKMQKQEKKNDKQVKKDEQWNRGKPNNKKISHEKRKLESLTLTGEKEALKNYIVEIMCDYFKVDNLTDEEKNSIDELVESMSVWIEQQCKTTNGINICTFDSNALMDYIDDYFLSMPGDINSVTNAINNLTDGLENFFDTTVPSSENSITATNSDITLNTDETQPSGSQKTHNGLIIGTAIGGAIIGAAFAAGATAIICKIRKGRKKAGQIKECQEKNAAISNGNGISERALVVHNNKTNNTVTKEEEQYKNIQNTNTNGCIMQLKNNKLSQDTKIDK